ncbi:MAG: hypothetical protein NC428_07030 [Clostridium sp.]|nr:hypothetical protein [Clostridium sp.]
MRSVNGKKEYGNVADEIHKLREQRQDVWHRMQNAMEEAKNGRNECFLGEQVNESLAYGEQLVRRLVEKIVVYENRLREV